MAFEEKHILNRLYIVAGCMFFFALAISVKLMNIQFVHGEQYRELAKENTTKNFIIPANRGNVYADDGSLLATSVPKYDIRFDAVTVTSEDFNENLKPLSEGLSKMFGKPVSYYQEMFRKARADKNRYQLVVKNLGYSNYIKVKNLPLFRKGPYKGGLIVEQRTVREHPIGLIAQRTVGDEAFDRPGYYAVGLEGAFNDLLTGKEGHRLKQKIAQGQWKPISDDNEIEPQDGYDIVSTINVNIQDIAHHALLKQLEYYEAEHGSVIVMEVATGEIKAVSNLGRTSSGTYYEKLNYAIGESHEPGSTFKVMAMMAALEDKVIDTSTVIDTGNGVKVFYGRKIYDSHRGGYGKISAAKALEVSSNIGLATIINDNYSKNPNKFIDRLKSWNLTEKTGVKIKGEGKPMIPQPGDKKWSKNALPSMAYGYNLRLTPLQTLTFYNAIANNGVMVKPRFIKEVRAWNEKVTTYDTKVINPKICSDKTLSEIKEIMKNIVKRGTGKSLYSPDFSMAGKTGTAQTEYWMPDWKSNRRYISSFAGFFPAENPKYSCIVIIHKPSTKKGFYGADVSGPVFKRIAQKIFTDSQIIDSVEDVEKTDPVIEKDYEQYYAKLQQTAKIIPNVTGMAGMDAVSLLENLGLKVQVVGNGTVSKQSLKSGEILKKGQQIILNLS
ncbi:penicillin-binding protein [Aequorivita antarctica]|uniref:PASTA domain-containing protein n=1 Tax=Aequorivita antarctica TaxID=153266 RepID=A0A5C6Z0D4_9FLAO|nr:penicillin-binding protein [Aequorivita antarctica]TXD72960.1 PASTA domain-containing protein [Aequorivita antarctica]SRX74633.1 Stage V sporulation protein D [Aequorivita antarctica]